MRGLWAGQIAIAVGTIVVIAMATLLPFNSPMPPSPLTTPASQAVNAGTKLLWLAAVLVARARQPGSPLWKILLGYVFAGEVWAFAVPNELTSALGEDLRPRPGRARPRAGRLPVRPAADPLIGGWSAPRTRRPGGFVITAPSLIRIGIRRPAAASANVFLVWPNDDFVMFSTGL
jgi:hypothetical protein